MPNWLEIHKVSIDEKTTESFANKVASLEKEIKDDETQLKALQDELKHFAEDYPNKIERIKIKAQIARLQARLEELEIKPSADTKPTPLSPLRAAGMHKLPESKRNHSAPPPTSTSPFQPTT